MASKAAYKRLNKEYLSIQQSPPPYIIAKPLESNILEWHYIIAGPPDSPYTGGQYHGKLIFPSDYPFKPPAIKMITPNGRFRTDFRLCLSMSDYHPGTWNPSWSVATILTGLLSFMLEDTATTGSIVTSLMEKKILAAKSQEWNSANIKFKEVFPEVHKANQEALQSVKLPVASVVPSDHNMARRRKTRSTESTTNDPETGNRKESRGVSSLYIIGMMLIGVVLCLFTAKVLDRTTRLK